MVRLIPTLLLPLTFLALIACGEIVVSADSDGSECEPNASIVNSVCVCDEGFSGDGQTCTDIDECATNNGGCDTENATCSNTPGAHSCKCNPGFVGDGTSCNVAWIPLGTISNIDLNPDEIRAEVVGTTNRLFFAPINQSISQQLLLSFDVSTMMFSGPLALPPETDVNDLQGAGFQPVFLSDGIDLFLLGNNGFRYDTANNVWSRINSYMGQNLRGEAAGAFLPELGSLILIGGRGSSSKSALIMRIPSETFTDDIGVLPVAMKSAAAHKPQGGPPPVIFVAGGDAAEGKALLSHTGNDGGWVRRADAPTSLGRPAAMGDFLSQLWVAKENGDFWFYNPTDNAWKPDPVKTPPGFAGAAMVGPETLILVQEGPDVTVYKLNAI